MTDTPPGYCDSGRQAEIAADTVADSDNNGSLFSASDAERMKWLAGVLSASPRSLSDEGAQELSSLCLRATRALGFAASKARPFPTNVTPAVRIKR